MPWYYEKWILIPRIIEQTFQISVNPVTETVQMRKTGGQHCSPGLDDYRLTSTTVHLERSNVWIIHTNELNYKEDNIQRPFHLQNYLDTLKYRVFKYPENLTLCPQAQCYFCFEKVTKRKVWQKIMSRKCGVNYTSARKKVPESRSGLCTSEMELPEPRSCALRHKSTAALA